MKLKEEKTAMLVQDIDGNVVEVKRHQNGLSVNDIPARILFVAPLLDEDPLIEITAPGGIIVQMQPHQYADLIGPISKEEQGWICATLDKLLADQAEEEAELDKGAPVVTLDTPIYCGGPHSFSIPQTNRATLSEAIGRPHLYLLKGLCTACEGGRATSIEQQ